MTSKSITVAGKINDSGFEECRICAKYLMGKDPNLTFYIVPLFETQWEYYLKKLGQSKGGSFLLHKKSPIIFEGDDVYIGGSDEFLAWAANYCQYVDRTKAIMYQMKANLNLKKITQQSQERAYVFLYLKYGDYPPGMIVLELFKDIAPKTCANFINLCNCNYVNEDGFIITYLGSFMNRVVKDSYIQGGTIKASKII